ncbi:MAG: hypothetical protein ACR2OM_07835 [Aestuariivirgaceae bacterium]
MIHWTISIGVFVAGLGLAGMMIWRERRPRKRVMPSLVPTTPVMFAGILIALLAIAYMLSLAGIDLPQR